MRKRIGWTLAALLVVAAPLTAQEDAAALVVRLQGGVQVRHAGAEPTPAAVGDPLAGGDEVVPEAGARAILITRTGATQVVTEPTTVAVPAAAAPSDMFARAVRTLAQAASGDARTAGGRQGMIRPIPGEPVLVAPRNGLKLADPRPTFRWMAVDGAPGYTIQIRKVEGGRPVRFETGAEPEWSLPHDADALERGATYAWTVAPVRGRPTREQRFTVLGAEAADEVRATLDEVAALGLDPQGDGAFLAALVYRDLGLPYEARAALARAEEGGSMGAQAWLLKGDILNLLGHAEEARAAFDRADEMMR